MVELEGKKTPRPSFTTCSRSRPISIAERHPCRVHRPCCRGRHRIAGRTRSVSEGMSRSGVGKSLPAVVFAGSNEHGGSMEQADQEEHFPRTIFDRSEEHTSELQSLMRTSSAAIGLKKKNINIKTIT